MRIANRHSTSDDATCAPHFPCRGGVTTRAAVKLMTEAPHAAADDASEVPPLSPAPTPVRNVACTLISVAIVVLLLQPMQSGAQPVRSWRAALLRARSGCGSTSEDPGATRPWRRSHAAHRCRGRRHAARSCGTTETLEPPQPACDLIPTRENAAHWLLEPQTAGIRSGSVNAVRVGNTFARFHLLLGCVLAHIRRRAGKDSS